MTGTVDDGASRDETAVRFDVLQEADGTRWVVPAGTGEEVVMARESDVRSRRVFGSLAVGVLPPAFALVLGVVYIGLGNRGTLALAMTLGLVVGAVGFLVRYRYRDHRHRVPELVAVDASRRVVEGYVDAFDPDAVSDPFERACE